ncbi:transcriptional regulator [Nocardioides pinisoli]|uniref:Transcriptional regulator n=1 Tax=Nocardioides pinisoli TaxID=2950279 RepID=A0ABT1KZ32_9ACTN|nr:transcriptional regulator [Nocardioides pinisoli]MCP3422589.1 transcriptional regulator [Nocardioides pinisoli]
MPTDRSSPALLTLHAVRLLGFADTPRVAARYRLDTTRTASLLEDFRAGGWVTRSEFAGTGGWSLTDSGRAEDERLLADELSASGGRAVVARVHASFVPLNARFQQAVTRWQLRPVGGNAFAANDHTDFRWDDRVIASLRSVGRRLGALEDDVTQVLPRFSGYAARYDAAIARVVAGQHQWVDGVGTDSCHLVWFQLHEDLLATLGLERGAGR